MDELKQVSGEENIKKSLEILKKCQDEAYERMSKLIINSMENPLEDVEENALALYMSLIAIDCLMELARTGYDMLSQVNDKDSAIKTVMNLDGITIETF